MIGKAAVLAIIAVLCVQHVAADIYLHSLRGGNNRLDEPSRDRNNGNRLWDSQNNNRGGSNHGTFGREYFYEGSTISIEWTSQHSCGHQNNYCEIILQYYCDNNQTRDGLTTNTIPTDQTQCMNYNCDTDTTYGRHESYQSYMDCVYRSRNKGLWTSSQDLQGNGAIYTRQNANGNRHGYECPEERDYYPYWHPNQWVDIAIFTTEPSRCPAYQAASQNVSPRSYCLVGQDMINKHVQANTYDGFIPITQKECEQNVLGTWVTVPSLQQQYPNANIQAPNCTAAPWSRDNHLGNGLSDQHPDGFPVGFNWTIPAGYNGQSCVFRIRYNVSTAETHDNNGAWASATSVQAGALNSTHNYTRYTLPNNINADPNNNDNDPLAYHYPANWDVWSKYKLTTADVAENFNPTAWGLDDPLGIKDTNGQIEGGYSSRGYVLSNYPVVDIFGSWFSQQGASPAINYKLRLALAIDTSQFGRTFEDRTHTFSIQPRPSFIPANAKIWNLGVRGKRGNIVQVFPGVEYDFTFNSLHVTQGDFVHFQWTGSNTNPNNNAGQGTQGTDRSNIILLRSNPVTENLAANAMKPFAGHTGSWKQTYPQDITQDDFVGFNTQQRRMLARNGIYTPIVNIGPYQVNANAGNIYNYVSTRNHAFTNRDQKAQIVVQPAAAAYTQIDTTHMLSQMVTPDGNAWVRFYPDPTGFTTGAQLWLDTDDQGRVVINPPFFDVVNGQKVMLDMRYDHGQNIMVHVPYILQSDYSDFSYYQTLTTSYNGGIASAAITRGGYYVCDVQPNIGAVVGIVIGVLAFAAICVFVYMQIRKRFRYGAKKTELMSTNTEMSSTSVQA